jgi:hypothetical protein
VTFHRRRIRTETDAEKVHQLDGLFDHPAGYSGTIAIREIERHILQYRVCP